MFQVLSLGKSPEIEAGLLILEYEDQDFLFSLSLLGTMGLVIVQEKCNQCYTAKKNIFIPDLTLSLPTF